MRRVPPLPSPKKMIYQGKGRTLALLASFPWTNDGIVAPIAVWSPAGDILVERKSFYAKKLTGSDTVQQIEIQSVPFFDINFHIYDNDILYGDGTTMDAIGQAGEVLFFRNGNLSHISFKNRTAGSNGVIVAAGTVPHQETLDALRL